MLGVNWQTSLAGLAVFCAACIFIWYGYSDGKAELAAIGVTMLPIAYGFLRAKDSNVTGGTVASTPEAVKRLNGASNKE